MKDARTRCLPKHARRWNSCLRQLFGTEYHHGMSIFRGIVDGLVGNTGESKFQFFLTQILLAEVGCDDPEQMQFNVFGRILRKLGLTKGGIHAEPRFGERRKLVEGMRRLCQQEYIVRGMGAQCALEGQAFSMMERLCVAFAQYENLTSADCEQFDLRLVGEREHLSWTWKCVRRSKTSAEGVVRVEGGARECWDLIAALWRPVHVASTALEDAEPCAGKGGGVSIAALQRLTCALGLSIWLWTLGLVVGRPLY